MRERTIEQGPYVGAAQRTDRFAAVGFLFFLTLISLLVMVMLNELGRGEPYLHSLAHNLGYVVATVLVVAGLALLQRTRTGVTQVRPVAAYLIGPSAAWAAYVVGAGLDVPPVLNLAIIIAALAGAIVLVAGVFTDLNWMKAFVGLGLFGFASAVSVVFVSPAGTHLPLFLSFTLVASASACLYGALIDVETETERTAFAFGNVHDELELTKLETADLLHDLRNGLLSVEAASFLALSDGSGALQAEIARLRLLTRRSSESPESFELIEPLRELSNVRRSAGAVIDLRAPERVKLFGCESQVVSVLQNLVDNAVRHGQGCVRITVEERDGSLVVEVADEGEAVSDAEAERLFERGVTSHPAGSGIGLDVARRLARNNNAELTYERTCKNATSFVLAFAPSVVANDGRPIECNS